MEDPNEVMQKLLDELEECMEIYDFEGSDVFFDKDRAAELILEYDNRPRPKRYGVLRVGCFEAQALRRSLRIAMKYDVEPLNSDEYNHAIPLEGRLKKMIEEKDC